MMDERKQESCRKVALTEKQENNSGGCFIFYAARGSTRQAVVTRPKDCDTRCRPPGSIAAGLGSNAIDRDRHRR